MDEAEKLKIEAYSLFMERERLQAIIRQAQQAIGNVTNRINEINQQIAERGKDGTKESQDPA